MPISDGKVNVTEIILDADSPVIGQSLKDIRLPEGTLIGVVIRDNQPIIPRGATLLLDGDHIVLITLPASHGPAIKALLGDTE